MAIHMKSLGITVAEAALILTILPFVSAIGPPLGGAIADKVGNYKLVFILATLVSVVLHLLLYFITPAYHTLLTSLPYDASSKNFTLNDVTFVCTYSGSLSLRVPVHESCHDITLIDEQIIKSLNFQSLHLG